GPQRQVLSEPIVEEPEAAPDDRPRLTRGPLASGRPGEAESRGEVHVAVDVALGLVADPQAQEQVLACPPVVLDEGGHVPLANRGVRIAAHDLELAGAAPQRSDLGRGQPLALEQQGAAIAVEGGDTGATGEDHRASEALAGEVVLAHRAEAEAGAERGLAEGPGGDVLRLSAGLGV